jgi:hypothetical protein
LSKIKIFDLKKFRKNGFDQVKREIYLRENKEKTINNNFVDISGI